MKERTADRVAWQGIGGSHEHFPAAMLQCLVVLCRHTMRSEEGIALRLSVRQVSSSDVHHGNKVLGGR